jgi:hypothetical protein
MGWTGRFETTAKIGRRGLVRLGEFLVPRKVTTTFDAENGDPDLVIQFEVRDGRPECVSFTVRSKPKGRGIRSADLTVFNIDGMTATAFSRWALAEGGTPVTGPPPEQLSAAARAGHPARKGRPRTATRAELEHVAQVYRDHVEGSPVQAVQQICGYGSERTAARRVEQARAAGLLPQTTPGKRRA